MNRDQFIVEAEKLSREDLQKIAEESRNRSGSRIPPEVQAQFRTLDDVTSAEETYVETSFGKTHIYIVKTTDEVQGLRPVLINVHGGGWCLPHTERDIFFSRRMAKRTG